MKKAKKSIDLKKYEKYKAELLEVIQDKKIVRISHTYGFISFTGRLIYNYKLNEDDEIQDALKFNRAIAANYLFTKWINSNNTTLQIAAMRLVSEPEEHRLLNQQYIEQRNIQEQPIFNIKPEIEDDSDR